MLAVNLGTKGFNEALAMLEYCNHPGGRYWSDLRRKNGSPEPHNVKALVPRQRDGRAVADESPHRLRVRPHRQRGRARHEGVRQDARARRLRLVARQHADLSGLGGARCSTECYDNVDYISLHTYWDNWDDDYLNFLAKSVLLDRYIHTVGGIIDYVKAKKRSKHDVYISFDEWNVWYHSRKQGVSDGDGVNWREGAAMLEDVYNFEDVLLVGCALNTFIRRADRVKIACIAQLVNVIAPIMTETGGPAWKQTTYYPYCTSPRSTAAARR